MLEILLESSQFIFGCDPQITKLGLLENPLVQKLRFVRGVHS